MVDTDDGLDKKYTILGGMQFVVKLLPKLSKTLRMALELQMTPQSRITTVNNVKLTHSYHWLI
jgi:hypothetical protein